MAEHEEEPTDEELCTEHYRYKPCRTCRSEAAEARADAERDDRDE